MPAGSNYTVDGIGIPPIPDLAQTTGKFTREQLVMPAGSSVVAVTKAQVKMGFGRFPDTVYFRAHPDPAFSGVLALYPKDGRWEEPGLILGNVVDALLRDLRYFFVQWTVSSVGEYRLYPVTVPKPGQKATDYTPSGLECLKRAETEWIRVANINSRWEATGILSPEEPNKEGEAKDDGEAKKSPPLPTPSWPDITFEQAIELIFGDRIISSVDHKLVRALNSL